MVLGTVCASGSRAEDDGAKSLFARQMSSPGESLNLGVQYWIELRRGNQVMHVDNRTSFQSGDKIRFHIKPNVNGYAYILLRSGSQGEQSVLFPDRSRGETNKVVAGNDYSLPADDFLQFDNNPGQEKLAILISRLPVDATAYLKTPEPERILIASAATGSKSLIPTQIVVAMAPSPAPVVQHTPPKLETIKPSPATKPSTKVAAQPRDDKSNSVTDKKKKDRNKKPVIMVAHHKVPSAKKTPSASLAKPATTLASSAGTAPAPAHDTQDSAVTIVRKDPTGVLAIDVALEHL